MFTTQTQTTTQPNLVDVLSGKQAIKGEVGISTESLFYLGLTLIVVILVGTLIIKKLK